MTRCGECRFGEICAYKHGIDESKARTWAMNEVGGEGELPKHEPSWTVFHLHCYNLFSNSKVVSRTPTAMVATPVPNAHVAMMKE
jgi:hypothetical protein